jgi:hypothetical protein
MGRTCTERAGRGTRADRRRCCAATTAERASGGSADSTTRRAARPHRSPGGSSRCRLIEVRAERTEQFLGLLLQLVERQFDRGRLRPDQQQTARQRLLPIELAHDRAQSSAEAVARHRRTAAAADRVGHARRVRVRLRTPAAPEGRSSDPSPVTRQGAEGVTAVDPLDQAESRARPLARRFFKMLRPERVLMRARKPCFLARRWALGWYVRFIFVSSSAGGRSAGPSTIRVWTAVKARRMTLQGYGCSPARANQHETIDHQRSRCRVARRRRRPLRRRGTSTEAVTRRLHAIGPCWSARHPHEGPFWWGPESWYVATPASSNRCPQMWTTVWMPSTLAKWHGSGSGR